MTFYVIQADDTDLVRNFYNVTEVLKEGNTLWITVEVSRTFYSKTMKTHKLENVISVESN
jgi:hypothetical protein